MAKRTIILDFDGTIVDDMQALAALGTYTINKYFGVSIRTAREMYWSTVGRPFAQQLIMLGYYPPTKSSAAAATEYELAKVAVTIGSPPTRWFSKFMQVGAPATVASATGAALIYRWLDVWQPWLSGGMIEVVQYNKEECLTRFKGVPATFYGDTDYDEELAGKVGIKFVRVK